MPDPVIPMTRRICFILMLTTAALTAAPRPCRAQEIDEAKLVRLKAAFIYNMLKFVQWPDNTFVNDTSPVRVAMVGDEPVIDVFATAVMDQTVHNRPVDIQRLTYPHPLEPADRRKPEKVERHRGLVANVHRQLADCHVVYLGPSEQPHWPRIHRAISDQPVLTVSDSPAFADRHGMVEITLDAHPHRLAMRIDLDEVEQSALKISSRLMGLADIVRHPPPNTPTTAHGGEGEP